MYHNEDYYINMLSSVLVFKLVQPHKARGSSRIYHWRAGEHLRSFVGFRDGSQWRVGVEGNTWWGVFRPG